MKSLGSQVENPPLEYINGWYVIRYGYEPVSDTEGVFTFVEHRFKTKPTIERKPFGKTRLYPISSRRQRRLRKNHR